jgi:hypothetical protein
VFESVFCNTFCKREKFEMHNDFKSRHVKGVVWSVIIWLVAIVVILGQENSRKLHKPWLLLMQIKPCIKLQQNIYSNMKNSLET